MARRQIKRQAKKEIKTLSRKKNVSRATGSKKAGQATEQPYVKQPFSALDSRHKEMLRVQEEAVKAAKYSLFETQVHRRAHPQELPEEYGVNKIVLQVRDPWWMHTYWELGASEIRRLQARLKDAFSRAVWCLRVYDVTDVHFDGSNAHRFFDIRIPDSARSWYIDAGEPGRFWCVDLGLLLADGTFITLLRSNVAQTPLDGPSGITDEEWMIPDELFARLYGLGFGFGKGSPGAHWRQQMKQLLSSGVFSSPTSGMVPPPYKERGFWLKVDCELIVYGATEPDAQVFIQGRKIAVRPDGTFTMRYALPDSEQVIDVRGISADRKEERVIVPKVSRKTTYQEKNLCTKDT